LRGLSRVAKPAPVAKSGRRRPPKQKATEVQASATRRGLGSVAKRNEVLAQQKRKPRTCKVENCPDPKNCPGKSNREWCLSFGDATDVKRRGTSPSTRKKRRTRTHLQR
jgi:hypothetical protein